MFFLHVVQCPVVRWVDHRFLVVRTMGAGNAGNAEEKGDDGRCGLHVALGTGLYHIDVREGHSLEYVEYWCEE